LNEQVNDLKINFFKRTFDPSFDIKNILVGFLDLGLNKEGFQISKPCASSFGTFFQIQKPLGLVRKLGLVPKHSS